MSVVSDLGNLLVLKQPDVVCANAAEAFVFGFPALELQRIRRNVVLSPDPRIRSPLNAFRHVRRLATPRSREVTAPNNDTLYSSAWLDLASGPVTLTVPPLGDRYYSAAFMDFYTNVFALPCRRTHPGGDRRYFVTGPEWKGKVPPLHEHIATPTNAVWLLVRIVVDGPADLPAVHALQDGFELSTAADPRTDVSIAIDAFGEQDLEKLFITLNAALTENPPPERDAEILSRLERIGVGPRQTFSLRRFDAACSVALRRGVAQGRERVTEGGRSHHHTGTPGVWYCPPVETAYFGTNYGLRAAVALAGLAALPREEATYYLVDADSEGRPFEGANRYELRFAPGQLPPAHGFWSLSIYEVDESERAWFTPNELNRYAIGDRTPDLHFGPSQSLDLTISHAIPEAGRANHLPAPHGRFLLGLRVYEPGFDIVSGAYMPPKVIRVDNSVAQS